MSSDDEFTTDHRRMSVASVEPNIPELPSFDNNNNNNNGQEDTVTVNGITHTTANDIANSDDQVKQVLNSDVCSILLLTNARRLE